MAIVKSAVGVMFAGFCLWLGVRIFNRRERWAKRTAVVVGVCVAYVLSFGPACWIGSRTRVGNGLLPIIYAPILEGITVDEIGVYAYSWQRGQRATCAFFPEGDLCRYAQFGAATQWRWRYLADYELPPDRDLVRVQGNGWEWSDSTAVFVPHPRAAATPGSGSNPVRRSRN